jgi:hypothetical protein
MTSDFGRIGRSYPRPQSEPEQAEHPSIGGFQVAGALIALLSALGLIGWYLAR